MKSANREPVGATAFRMLRSDPTTAAGEPHHIELATMLIVRESTGPPRPDGALWDTGHMGKLSADGEAR